MCGMEEWGRNKGVPKKKIRIAGSRHGCYIKWFGGDRLP